MACGILKGKSFFYFFGVNAVKRRNEKESTREMWRILTVYGSLSLNLGFMAAGGYFLGHLLEENYHWNNFTAVGVLTGLFLGFLELFIIAYKAGVKK